VIRVIVTPLEVFPLLGSLGFVEFAIFPVLFSQVNAVSTIFSAVPRMVIVTFPVVVPLIMMIVGHHRHWGNEGSAGAKHTQNQKTMHIVSLVLLKARY
jgi:hypothetical protein